MAGDLYEILQVSPRAEQEIIESAYHRLAQKYHPDLNKTPEAPERMRQINRAYEILRDPVRRSSYDAWDSARYNTAPPPQPTVEPKPEPPPPRTYTPPPKTKSRVRAILVGIGTIIVILIAIARFINFGGYVGEPLIITSTRVRPTTDTRMDYYVCVDAATVYASPNLNAVPQETLRRGQRVPVVQVLDEWHAIGFDGNIDGYIRRSQLCKVSDQVVPPNQNFSAPADTGCPDGCTSQISGCDIKGNVSFNSGEKIYHRPGDKFYGQTEINTAYGEYWFCTEAEAEANGWRHTSQ